MCNISNLYKFNMDIKYTNHTDIIVAGASLLSIMIMAVNTLFHSVIPLYISSVVQKVLEELDKNSGAEDDIPF